MSDRPTDGAGAVPDPAENEIVDQTPDEPVADDLDDGEPPIDDGEDEGADPPSPAAAQPRGRGPKGRPYGEQLRERDEKIGNLERQMQAILAERNQPRQLSPAEQAEQDRIYRERFEMLSPWEQHQETLRRIGEQVGQQTNGVAAAVLDRADRTDFEARLRADPRLGRYRDEVENLRRQFPGLSRTDVLLPYAIGQAALANMGRTVTRATTRAQQAAERQGATPSRASSDVPGGRQRTGQTAADRLRGVQI